MMDSRKLQSLLLFSILVAVTIGCQGQAAGQSSAMPTTVLVVDAKSGPWDWETGGANKYYAYGNGRHGKPAIFRGHDGKGLSPGQILSVRYLKGRCRAWDPGFDNTNGPEGYPKTDASSYTGNSGNKLPSIFVHPTEWPTFIMALIGVFTDSAGNIVGFPFKVGEQSHLTVPGGAAQLQFGLNDDLFDDNSGFFEIAVSEEDVPAPPGKPFNAP